MAVTSRLEVKIFDMSVKFELGVGGKLASCSSLDRKKQAEIEVRDHKLARALQPQAKRVTCHLF